ncbi:MAG: hypothetical protein ACE5HO_06970 [bacterium]
MNVEFVCSNCKKDITVPYAKPEETIHCPHCDHEVPLQWSKSMQQGHKVDRCAVCGKIRFYVQKDFNPRLGILIFAIGVIFSYHTYGLTLAIATLIDFILYKVLKTVTICYNCRAIYRGFEEDPTHRGFDHNLAMTLLEKKEPETKEAPRIA